MNHEALDVIHDLEFATFPRGDPGTEEYRVAVTRKQSRVDRTYVRDPSLSAWHDVPLLGRGRNPLVLRYVNEVPRGTTAKMEMADDEIWNPIRQDKNKDGSLRHFQYGACPFNYGFLPQTFEDPEVVHEGLPGDGDPVDVVEISSLPLAVGEVAEVYVLGVMGLVDQGEMDWKVIAVDTRNPWLRAGRGVGSWDPQAPDDIAAGVLGTVRDWFENYKVPEGKSRNGFLPAGEDGAVFFGPAEAVRVISGAHEDWFKLACRDGGMSGATIVRRGHHRHVVNRFTVVERRRLDKRERTLHYPTCAEGLYFFQRPGNGFRR